MTLFLRVLEASDKATALKDSITTGTSTFEVDPDSFAQVPGSPFAYWVSDRIRRLFKELPPFEGEGRTVRVGLQTSDDFRFVRAWWEIPEDQFRTKWFPFAKGGAYSPYYADIHLVVNWENAGSEICNFIDPKTGKTFSRPQNTDFYFRSGLTWGDRTSSRLSVRAWPAGGVFSVKGSAGFFGNDTDNLATMALMNSTCHGFLLEMLVSAGTAVSRSYQVGVLGIVPYPKQVSCAQTLSSLAFEAWKRFQIADQQNESSHAFVQPNTMSVTPQQELEEGVDCAVDRIIENICDVSFGLYGIDGEDRKQIEEWAKRGSGQGTVVSGQLSEVSDQLEEEPNSREDEPEDEAEEDQASTDNLASLLSWGVGVAFGRFDIRLATGERQPPPDPEPFDPLPKRSPGMVPEGDPVFRPGSGIHVDDPGHTDDLTACVRSVLERVSMPAPDNLRQWLAKDFFPLHIRMYSKSRRKAPIYWQLSTPSGSYSVWVYIHAFTRDTLFRVQNDYVAPKLEHELRRLDSMRSGMSPAAKAAELKALATQEAFVQELKDLLAELRLVTPLWVPELDDGVVINSAPLWRLFSQNRAWQKELRSIWDSLCAGKYDWSHMAMHLWPGRVVPKCATDRSLAIAHGLEDVFWVEGADGKWAKRPEPGTPLEELLMERESGTVKDSLASLLAAPAAGTGQTGRRGRSKGN